MVGKKVIFETASKNVQGVNKQIPGIVMDKINTITGAQDGQGTFFINQDCYVIADEGNGEIHIIPPVQVKKLIHDLKIS